MASQSYQQRVTARIPATMAAHPGWTEAEARRFLRGHGSKEAGITPEHGSPGRQPRIGAETRGRATTAEPGRPRVEVTHRDTRVITEVNRVARVEGRVQINTHTAKEGWQRTGQTHRGFSAKYVAQKIANHNGNVRKAVADLVADSAGGHGSDFDLGDYGDVEDYVESIDDWQIVEYD